ncbi:MAG: glycosyltransferase family 4 protein [Spirochaetales bacterium]|nr:glycosyltransferase family 4 protein [Spirochaetales bacterium]
MKILFIAQLASIHSRRWILSFPAFGNEVHVLDTSGENEEKHSLEDIPIFRTEYRKRTLPVVIDYFFRFRRFKKYLAEMIEKIKPDVIHVQSLNIYSYVVSRLNFHPFLITIWGSDLLYYLKRNLRTKLMAKRSLRTADTITCDAFHIVEELKKHKVRPERIKVVFFGTDTEKYHPSKRDPRLAEKLGYPAGTRLVISLRAMESVYNIETYVKAAPEVLKAYPNTAFVIVGGGSEKEMIQSLAVQLGVEKRIVFAGRLSDEDMQCYIASADIYVSTSLSDAGLAASTAEAMSCCVPVVITRFGDNAIWLDNEQAGLLFAMRDHAMLSAQLKRLLGDDVLRKHMGARGRTIIDVKNNHSVEMAKMNGIYQSLAAGFKKAGTRKG